jgi:hypothetical protein
MLRALAIVVASLLFGCGDVTYMPAAGPVVSGQAVRGGVRLTVDGVSGAPPTLHAHLDAANADDVAWRITPAAQQLALPDGRLVNAEPDAPLDVPPRARGAVALSFVLPSKTKPDKLAIRWQLERQDGAALTGRVQLVAESIFPTMPCGPDADPYCLSGYAGGN